ncbi:MULTISPECIES: hypothetical protein [Alteromonadaceae]|uniref:hypothetical protein n=1 Tax=Alteromonadaceae TaxID=72275 RepID=UPI001C0824A2|nr:hypothetical protein [Aliiglaciecola lipolytica]MBU2878350.1 hypothetical protein [Aliiglaciecola lipolytica]
MKMHKSLFVFSVSLLFFSITLIQGCSSQMAANLRKVTYPPDFKYVEPSQLRSDMDRLAQQMRVLEFALSQQHEPQSVGFAKQQQQVLSTLQNIEKIASGLRAGDAGASHPFLQDYMRDFVSKVDNARIAASLEKPSYYLAGKVSGACTNCHSVNR